MIALAIYAVFILLPAIAFLFASRKSVNEKAETPNLKVSVIVPLRNEANEIEALLKSLDKQTHTDFELILVNDHSTDDTENTVRRFLGKKMNWQLISNDGNRRGKKAALSTGVAAAKGEIILTTDGDCVLPPNWIAKMISPFVNQSTQLVCGIVQYKKRKGLLWPFLQAEQISLQVISSGLAFLARFNLSRPIFCSGASMAYRKSFFEKAKGYENDPYVSGDDVFLLQKAILYSKKGICFVVDRTAVVETEAAPSFDEALNQRARWISKAGGYRSFFLWLYSLIMLFANIGFILAFLVLPFFPALVLPWLLGKALIDVLLLSLAFPFFREPWLFFVAVPGAFFYPVFAMMAVIRSRCRKLEWKGRKWKK
jgi:poly-beta-1,6-N-acetyl-D-glucosamine synthase